MTSALYLFETSSGQRNGGSIRREGLLDGLRAAGANVTLHPLTSPWPKRSMVRRFSGQGLAVLQTLEPAADVLIVEGLALAPVVRAGVKAGRRVVWDLCDSWPLRYFSQIQSGDVSALAGLLASVSLVRWGARKGVVALYISERDARVDRFFRGGASTFIVPNGTRSLVTESHLTAPLPRRIVMFADWNYPPNRQGLKWIHRAAASRQIRVDLYGSGGEMLPKTSWYHARGYVPDLGKVLADIPVVAAPIVSGAGIKNKVLESAATGMPVVTTPEGTRGMVPVPPWVAIERSPQGFVAKLLEWSFVPPRPSREEVDSFSSAHSWDHQVQLLARLASLNSVE
ncbi:MAG: glycosyltransferase [Actinomycetales bacterium]